MLKNFRKRISYGLVKKINRKIENKKEKKELKSSMCLINLMGLVGWTLMVPIFLAMFIGNWLTEKFNNPMFMVGFIFLGIFAGFANIFKEVNKYYKSIEGK